VEVLFITSIEARTDDFQVLDDTARLGTTAEPGKDQRREEVRSALVLILLKTGTGILTW